MLRCEQLFGLETLQTRRKLCARLMLQECHCELWDRDDDRRCHGVPEGKPASQWLV